MDELLKVLVADEKRIDILTVRYNILKKNIANETKDDTETRTHLRTDIAKIKKSNAVIVEHYLGERTLAPAEIDKILVIHSK